MNYEYLLAQALHQVKEICVQGISLSPSTQTVSIIFRMDNRDLRLAQQNMKVIVGVVQRLGTKGYRLRLGAKMENGLMGLILTLSEQTVKNFNTWAETSDWAEIAEDYRVEKQLRRWYRVQQRKMTKE